MPGPWRRLALVLTVGAVAFGFLGSSGAEERPVVRMTAKRFSYDPDQIHLKKGVPVTLEITSLDRDHGFKIPALGMRADIHPGETTRVDIVPDKAGKFDFLCDNFCGSGHEEMDGEIVVEE